MCNPNLADAWTSCKQKIKALQLYLFLDRLLVFILALGQSPMVIGGRMVRPNRISRSHSTPAPVGGWNARDSAAEMPPGDAVQMDNWFPSTTFAALRNGCSDHVTAISDKVETLAAYNSGATSKLFAAAGAKIYDTTTAGAVGAAVVTGQTSARWQKANFSAGGGDYLYLVNGADAPQLYNGTAWQAVTGVSAPVAITGVTTTSLVNICVHQSRLWFVEKNKLKVWYLATLAIGGAATAFDLAPLFRRGGYVVSMGSWTIDSGSGMDDLAVFITSQGEVAVYQGTDPSSASTWSLKGLYYIGEPIGYRCMSQYASDLLIICKDGLQPMSKALASSRVSTKTSMTDKIVRAMNDAIDKYGTVFGWECLLFSGSNMLVMNVPVSNNIQQFVMNTITGSWCRFLGWNSYCYEVFNGNLYYGGDTAVTQAYVGTSDNGANINSEVISSFNDLGFSALKGVKLARPLLAMDTEASISLGINVDYETEDPTGSPTFSGEFAGVWDVSKWDDAIWGGDPQIKKDWQTVFGLGYTVAMHIKTASSTSVIQWFGTDYIFEAASGL